nr:ABC transporter G family member 11 [Ipomoea batatas]
MVQFQDQWFEGQRKLVISSTKSDHKVTLAVNHPLASPSPPMLTVSYHERNWTPEYNIPPSKVWTLQPGLKHEPSSDILPTLGNRIIDDEALCEEWCPRTNTLITSSGEMSISLRDLYILGGLPLLGDIYDERIPNALDLNKGSYTCCAHLLEAFFHLTQQENHTTFIQASRWIDFWCRKTRRYPAPPPRKENKKSRPKATHNPSGILETAPRWSHVSKAPFVELNIPQNLEQEVYLAAFLVFLFYAKDANVRLSLMYPIASVVSLDSTKHMPPKLQELVTEAQGLRDTSQDVVTSAEETVKRIQDTPMLTSEDEDKLSLAEKDLGADKADLMNFRIV